jgi:hypothetical protein
VSFHEIGHVLVKLSVEHADAIHNLARVSEFVRQVRTRLLDEPHPTTMNA